MTPYLRWLLDIHEARHLLTLQTLPLIERHHPGDLRIERALSVIPAAYDALRATGDPTHPAVVAAREATDAACAIGEEWDDANDFGCCCVAGAVYDAFPVTLVMAFISVPTGHVAPFTPYAADRLPDPAVFARWETQRLVYYMLDLPMPAIRDDNELRDMETKVWLAVERDLRTAERKRAKVLRRKAKDAP